MTLTARQLYFEGVKVGDELPPLVKPPVDRLQIARYVGAAADWNPLYIDEPHAKASGFPSAFAPGLIALGFLGELTTDWVRGARLRKLQGRFVKIVWPNDVLTARGRVSDRRFEPGGVYGIDIEIWAENQRGELVTRGLATFQLYYSAEDEARQRAGQAPLVVTLAEEEARLARLSRAQPPRPPLPPRPMQPARPIAPPAAAPPPSVAAKATGVPARAGAPSRPSPVARPVAQPAARPTPKAPAVKAPASPAARPAARPAAKPVARPVAKPSRNAARPAPRSVAKPAARRTPATKAGAKGPKATRKPGAKKKR
jgi:acyl dehydratase